MRLQLIGFGNVGRNLVSLIREKQERLEFLETPLEIVSISDSKGTAINRKGLELEEVIGEKKPKLSDLREYIPRYSAIDSIRNIESDIVVELTPSTDSGEPGLSHIREALKMKKNVVTANKGPLVVAYNELVRIARENGVNFLYEATVAAHVPVFCLIDSCFKIDELVSVKGVLNATTNFMLGEMEKGRTFQTALSRAVSSGWTEKDGSDDVDGIDAARKVVILAKALFKFDARMKDVNIRGIRNADGLVKKARKLGSRVKLLCEISRKGNEVVLSVAPKILRLDDPLNTVNAGDMGLEFVFRKSKRVFISVEFNGPEQTAQAVLNDIVKAGQIYHAC